MLSDLIVINGMVPQGKHLVCYGSRYKGRLAFLLLPFRCVFLFLIKVVYPEEKCKVT